MIVCDHQFCRIFFGVADRSRLCRLACAFRSMWPTRRTPRRQLNAVCRSDAGCANHPRYFGREDRSAQGSGPRSFERMPAYSCNALKPPGPAEGMLPTPAPVWLPNLTARCPLCSDCPPGETSRSPRGKLANMSEVTRILSAIEQGDPSAAEQLLPLVLSPGSRHGTRAAPAGQQGPAIRLRGI